ncbi:molybdopterin-dependent oxidoreductase [Brucella anthropi]|uniref:molybdopterin-dependent oxidoreductase n=1 Tax=Brucella anthropi TaxID=529 RepID=UPI002361A839|nr:molybdopterin-dependent oxidoreductase [Brucella anthropi]
MNLFDIYLELNQKFFGCGWKLVLLKGDFALQAQENLEIARILTFKLRYNRNVSFLEIPHVSCATWMFAFRRLLALPALIAFFAVCQITHFTGAANAESHAALKNTLTIIAPNGTTHVLSTDEFANLPQNKLQTKTAWTEGPQSFEGVLLRDVLAAVGVDGRDATSRSITVLALNDYSIRIPLEDAYKYNVLVARRMNGRELSLRDKGPYWLVYPRDQHQELNDSRYDHRWAWQLKQIEVK